MQKEKWNSINGFEGLYMVSNKGRVKSLDRKVLRTDGKYNYIKEKIFVNKPTGHGYFAVTLCRAGLRKYISIHRLVALHHIRNIHSKTDVINIEGDKMCDFCKYKKQ